MVRLQGPVVSAPRYSQPGGGAMHLIEQIAWPPLTSREASPTSYGASLHAVIAIPAAITSNAPTTSLSLFMAARVPRRQ